MEDYRFPFGERLHRLVQEDRTPKKVFVLGVYASAVHALWMKDGKIKCRAMDVTIQGKTIKVLPLAHPRQIGALGTHSEKWYQMHQKWENKR